MEWEFYILDSIQNKLRMPWSDVIMQIIAPFWLLIIMIALPAFILLVTKKHARLGRLIAAGAAVNSISCVLILKPIVSRIRPYELNSTVSLIVPPEMDACFPSGHTSFAFCAATACFLYNRKLGLVMYAYALLIAFSRLYLYMHYPTDVICGALLGIIAALIGYLIEKILFERLNANQKKITASVITEPDN